MPGVGVGFHGSGSVLMGRVFKGRGLGPGPDIVCILQCQRLHTAFFSVLVLDEKIVSSTHDQ